MLVVLCYGVLVVVLYSGQVSGVLVDVEVIDVGDVGGEVGQCGEVVVVFGVVFELVEVWCIG